MGTLNDKGNEALNGCLAGLQENMLAARHKHDQLFSERKKKVGHAHAKPHGIHSYLVLFTKRAGTFPHIGALVIGTDAGICPGRRTPSDNGRCGCDGSASLRERTQISRTAANPPAGVPPDSLPVPTRWHLDCCQSTLKHGVITSRP